jgi:hypothetical protein
MKKIGYVLIPALVGALTLFAVQTAPAAGIGSFSYPAGQIVYNYVTPNVSMYGSVQVGGQPSASVTQNSTHNLAVVGQVGTRSTASITQSGSLNAAHITQVGPSTNALTVQFGNVESIIGQ